MGKRRYNNTIRSDKPLRQAAILRSADSRRLDSAAGLGVRHEATAAARSGTSMGAAGVGCVGRRDDRLPDGLFDDRGNRRVFQVTQSHIMQPPASRISSARCPIAKLCSTPMPGRAEIVAPDKLTAPPRASQLWPFQLTTAARPRRSATTTAARCSREIVRRIARRSITAWKTPVQERIARNDGQPSAPVALDAGIADRVRENQSTGGAVPSPFDCWLVHRGIQTLPWRMRAHSENALRIATWLADHPRVETVHYPGLSSHSSHEIAARQMSAFSGMLSFEVRGGRDAALGVAAKTEIFIRATSLGGVESLIEHRASIKGEDPRTPQGLLRLSIGLEHADDLIEDLAQALA